MKYQVTIKAWVDAIDIVLAMGSVKSVLENTYAFDSTGKQIEFRISDVKEIPEPSVENLEGR